MNDSLAIQLRLSIIANEMRDLADQLQRRERVIVRQSVSVLTMMKAGMLVEVVEKDKPVNDV